jgi:hypothetical protein
VRASPCPVEHDREMRVAKAHLDHSVGLLGRFRRSAPNDMLRPIDARLRGRRQRCRLANQWASTAIELAPIAAQAKEKRAFDLPFKSNEFGAMPFFSHKMLFALVKIHTNMRLFRLTFNCFKEKREAPQSRAGIETLNPKQMAGAETRPFEFIAGAHS